LVVGCATAANAGWRVGGRRDGTGGDERWGDELAVGRRGRCGEDLASAAPELG